MLYEYAVEPQALGGSWETFRYIIEQFGFDRGRLISQFPKHWSREVYEATTEFSDIQRKRVEEALSLAKRNKFIRAGRPYDPKNDWLQNAIVQHAAMPFRAIIGGESEEDRDFIIRSEELHETHPLMRVSHDAVIPRDAASLAAALGMMLRFGREILFVDPYYDPFSPRYRNTIRECLRIVGALNEGAACEIHHIDRDTQPSIGQVEGRAANVFGDVIPGGMTLTIYRWRERTGGEDFHARYLLTNQGGIHIDAGFSDEGSAQSTQMSLMTYELSQAKRHALARDANVYELVEPVIQVSRDGTVRHV